MAHTFRGPIGDAANVARGKPAKPTPGTVWDANTILAGHVASVSPEVATAIAEVLGAAGEYRNKVLSQDWEKALLTERGATKRQEISSKASTKNARIAADASRYAADTQAQTAREKLGLDALELPAKYRGPADFFQQSDILRGMSQRQDVPVFVQSLINGGAMPGFGASGGAPAGFNLQGVVNAITGQANGTPNAMGATQGQNGSALAAIRGLAQNGFQKLQPGALERLTPSELGLLKSGVEYSGDGGPAWNYDDLMQVRTLNSIGQQNAQAA